MTASYMEAYTVPTQALYEQKSIFRNLLFFHVCVVECRTIIYAFVKDAGVCVCLSVDMKRDPPSVRDPFYAAGEDTVEEYW